ncbi:hypothetical protein BGW42_003956 [Actinomortierella wolfii]|nr:hypothetical protein BGW42_003956 [Actinomortierella wolfii]
MAHRAMSLPRPGMSHSPWSATVLLVPTTCRPFSLSTTALKKARGRAVASGGGGGKRTASVSGHQMVSAIEGRRARRGNSGAKFKRRTTGVGDKAFPEETDPFSNKFDNAIRASNARWKDAQAESGSEQAAKAIPDIEGKYLIGSARWESLSAKEVIIKNVTPTNRPKIAQLAHGLDRVLFNPGVHWLQDPRSAVFNFNPYLKSICQPADFDYNALPAYMRPSQDPHLNEMTRLHNAKYMGSTSSMTSILSQFYFLIAAWKPMKMSHLSGVFAYQGKSMEKMLTSTPEEFARYRKENSWQVTEEERNAPEAFNYITVDNFLLRSQLDCEDERLPGRTFDLKTRAAVAIRLDIQNYEQHSGYQLRKSHGFLESFEREYYDMMRSAFLKYSLQVRIGQMDGIFVAFHNTARIFGFQYISLEEMDSRLFGSTVMGNECFRNQLRLLSRTLDEITAKYPEQDLRITLDTHELAQRMNVWVETLPLGRDAPVTFDAEGVPEMQPGAELALWQIVCFSTINGIDTVGPFDLSDGGQDDWILNYKIAQLKQPDMLKKFHRTRVIQTEICRANEREEEAVVASAGSDPEVAKKRSSSPPSSGLLATLHKISERGRQLEEAEAERDKKVVVWEPKGYVKIEDLATLSKPTESTTKTGNEAEPTVDKTPQPSPPTTPTATTTETTLSNVDKVTDTPAAPHTPPSLETLRSKMQEKLSQIRVKELDEYPIKEEGDQVTLELNQGPLTISKDEYQLMVKGRTQKLSLQDLSALSALYRKHPVLSSTFGYVDDLKTRFRQIPYNPEREQLTRSSMEVILKALDEPTDGTDEEVKARVLEKAVRGRSRLVLEYFHRRVPLIAASREAEIRPITALDIATGKVEFLKLQRILSGMDSHPLLRHQARKQDPTLTESEAAAVVLLSNVFFAERRFSDDELKAMGYPRIFRRKNMPNSRVLLQPSTYIHGVDKDDSAKASSKKAGI